MKVFLTNIGFVTQFTTKNDLALLEPVITCQVHSLDFQYKYGMKLAILKYLCT